MTSTRYSVVAGGLLGVLAIAVLGILTRDASLTALRGARAAVHAEIERLEGLLPSGRPTDETLWRAHLDVVEKELEHGHVDVAVRVWQDAYGAALGSRSWESMIAVGDAFMAIGRASGSLRGARMNARQAYLTALIRARRARSVDGVLRTAQAFRELGDTVAAEQCLHIAGQLAPANESSSDFASLRSAVSNPSVNHP